MAKLKATLDEETILGSSSILPTIYKTWTEFHSRELKDAIKKYPDATHLHYEFRHLDGKIERRHYRVSDIKASLYDELITDLNRLHKEISTSDYSPDPYYKLHRLRVFFHEIGIES